MPEAGTLLAIGGHEDLTGARQILRAVARLLLGRPLALVTSASTHPDAYVDRYTTAFADLAVTVLPLDLDGDPASLLAQCGGVFLTGGKQERLLRRLHESGVAELIRGLHESGGVVAGTSAGASVLTDRMILSDADDLRVGPGLALAAGAIIDQHFSQRDRADRLRAALALEPGHIGIGIDEDTAVQWSDETLTVLGTGTVTIMNGSERVLLPGQTFEFAQIQ